jgi:site-specific DNA-methyltransferase (adenine-specific)/site-specific DNA-methyltransferase (cytosine-N4-specific)
MDFLPTVGRNEGQPNPDEAAMIARIRELSADSLDSAMERGYLLKELNLKEIEYQAKRVGVSYRTGRKLIAMVDHERMRRDDWTKPGQWTACYELLECSDKVFDAMREAGHISYHTTARQVRAFARAFRQRIDPVVPPAPVAIPIPSSSFANDKFLNHVTQGNCFDLIPQLEDESIAAVITSPPYAEQRNDFYQGVPEKDYPAWFVRLMETIRPKLKRDGSVLVVIRSKVQDGALSDYVLRTVLAVRESGWNQPEELIWYKSDGPPNGASNRPRRAFEHILWFSKTRRPYINLQAAGKQSKRIGNVSESKKTDRLGLNRRLNFSGEKLKAGTARITDVIKVGVSQNDKGIDHPAIYPRPLANKLLLTFTKIGDTILEPFGGSGTTALSAATFGRDFVAFELEQRWVDLGNQRLHKDDSKYKDVIAEMPPEPKYDERPLYRDPLDTDPEGFGTLYFAKPGTWIK